MSRREYSAEVKAAALAALMAGQGVTEVAGQYQIPAGTLKSWRNRSQEEDGSAKDATVAPEQKAAIGDLLLQYLEANLVTLKKQLEVFSDVEWLKKQGAADVAVLHGVMTDKSIRLLEALGGPGNASS